jgi:hypothetical protein
MKLHLRPLWGYQSFSKRFGEEEMLLALPGVETRVAQSTAVLRECKCENKIVTGPSRSVVKLLIGLNHVGLCEYGNEHFCCKQSENI